MGDTVKKAGVIFGTQIDPVVWAGAAPDAAPLKVIMVCATRRAEADFWAEAPLGRSMEFIAHQRQVGLSLYLDNHVGLPQVYNQVIARAEDDALLVFAHDDVWLQDIFWVARLARALETWDVVGVAGNTRRQPGQVSWRHQQNSSGALVPDDGHLSGVVGYGPFPFRGEVLDYGPVPAACELLDGMLLAVRKSTLTRHGLAFDPQFQFDFHDLDFCRSARQRGLRLGTCRLSVTHQSAGRIGSPEWLAMREAYLRKWGD